MRPRQYSRRSPIRHRSHRREKRTQWWQPRRPDYYNNHQLPFSRRRDEPQKSTRPLYPSGHHRQSGSTAPPPAELRDYSPSSPYYSAVSPNYCARYYYSPPDDLDASYSPWSPVYASPSPVYLPSSPVQAPPLSPLSPVHSPSFSPLSPVCSPPYFPYTPPRIVSRPSPAANEE